MTREAFNNLKVGDEVCLNGLCRVDAGAICKVTYIRGNRMRVKPVSGTLKAKYGFGDMNAISYKAANIIVKKDPVI